MVVGLLVFGLLRFLQFLHSKNGHNENRESKRNNIMKMNTTGIVLVFGDHWVGMFLYFGMFHIQLHGSVLLIR